MRGTFQIVLTTDKGMEYQSVEGLKYGDYGVQFGTHNVTHIPTGLIATGMINSFRDAMIAARWLDSQSARIPKFNLPDNYAKYTHDHKMCIFALRDNINTIMLERLHHNEYWILVAN